MSISQEIIGYGDMFRGMDTKQLGYTSKQVLDKNMHRWAEMAQRREDSLKAEIRAMQILIDDMSIAYDALNDKFSAHALKGTKRDVL